MLHVTMLGLSYGLLNVSYRKITKTASPMYGSSVVDNRAVLN